LKVKGISNESIVVPGVSEVIDRLSLSMLLIRVDLPTLGLPMNATRQVFDSVYKDGLVIENDFSINCNRPLLVFADTSKVQLNPNSPNSNLLRSDFCLSHLLIIRIIFLLSFLSMEQISLSFEVMPSYKDVTKNINDDLSKACNVFS